jgi:YVTN family beta-propeller protein
MKHLLLSLFVGMTLFFAGCEDENNIVLDVTSMSGYYVVNEGSWGNSNASVGFMTADGTYYSDLFHGTNNRFLGDVLQSMCIYNNKAYMVLNGSNKVETMTANTFEELGTIEGFYSPRYVVVANNKAYVSQWGDFTNEGAAVKVIDLSARKVVKSIETGSGSERMLVLGSKILVANSGGYGSNNTISVIDTNTDAVTKTITLADDCPKGFTVDKNGAVWVICYGAIVYNADYSIASQTRSALVKLDATTLEPVATIALSSTMHHDQIGINPAGDLIYFGAGYSADGIYAVAIDANQAPTTPFISGYFYGFSVNATNGEIVGLQAPSFSAPGSMVRYNPQGTVISTTAVGIGPSSAIYKQ